MLIPINMRIDENVSLKPYNTFGMDVFARKFARFSSADELLEIFEHQNEECFFLGGGSNILFTRNVNGILMKNEIPGIELINSDADHYYVKAGAGENWHRFVMYCVDRDYAGVENLALIPGNVGASPMQNIGAYGVEVKDVFYALEALHIKDKHIRSFTRDECKFGYRESIFKSELKGEYVILNVTFRLLKKPVYHTGYGAIKAELEMMGVQELSIRNIANAVIKIRQSKLPDPEVIGNAGSFFKNPEIESDLFKRLEKEFPDIIGYSLPAQKVKLAAGWLIEQCGWKGYRNGDAGCHARQALVLVNYGNANGAEILQLSEKIIDSVRSKFGVTLQREVNVY